MSSVKGDVAVGRNVDIGGDVDIKGHIHAGHNLTVDGWLDAPNVKGPSKGLFPSETAMKGAYPLPEPGWWALVGDTLPADVWCVVDGEWTATGKKSGNLTVANLTLDARIDEVKKAVDLTTAALDALVSGDTSDAIDNYNEIIKFLEGFRDDETLAGTLKTLRDTAEEAHTRLSAGLSAALPRIVSIADIDTMGTDGSAEALRNFMRELIRTGPAHTRYALVNGNYIAGVLEIFSDNSLHCITQVLETHQSVEDGVLLPNGHDDGRIRRWWRTMNFAGNSQSGLTAGVWTPWRECEPEGLREDLTEHKTQYRDLVHRVEGIISRANRIMDFNGFVTRVEDVPTNDANAVYWVTSVGGFRSGLAPDDPTLRELSDYNLDDVHGEGRNDRLFRLGNDLYMVNDESADNLVRYCHEDDLAILRGELERNIDGVAGRVEELETGHVPSNQYYALCESLFGRDFTLVANEKVRGLWAYDRNTRRYSFDRLTNITRPQMDAALLAAPLMFRAAHQAGDFALPGLRFCVIPYGTTLAAGMFADSEVEEAVFPGTFNNYPSISGTPNLFDGAAKLRYVVGYLNVRWAAEGSMQTFRGCSALEEIRIFKLTQNISFSDSPNLSMESLQYLVDNASNTSSIFVGLHADCYARLTEEVRAAANEKGISFGIV